MTAKKKPSTSPTKKPAKKPAKKRPLSGADFTGPPAQLWAFRTRKTKTNGWFPDKVAFVFDKQATNPDHQEGTRLFYTGWTVAPSADDTFPADRLEYCLEQLATEWEEEVAGKGWEVRIVPVP